MLINVLPVEPRNFTDARAEQRQRLRHINFHSHALLNMSRDTVFVVSDQVRHKLAFTVTRLEMSDLGRREIVLSEEQKQRR